jgi:hypothetical protein
LRASCRGACWEGDNLSFTVAALAQSVANQVEIFDDRVRAIVDLPPMLAPMAEAIRAKSLAAAAKLLC